jgi:hypothetical protein
MKILIGVCLVLSCSISQAKGRSLELCGEHPEEHHLSLDYEKLTNGMTEKEVDQKLGCYGTEMSTSGDTVMEKYEQYNDWGIVIVYYKYRLISKSHYGF